MNFNEMEIEELKEYAKNLGINVGRSGKEKLISKIEEYEKKTDINDSSNISEQSETIKTNELAKEDKKLQNVSELNTNDTTSLLESISDAIDDLGESATDTITESISLPLDEVIPVKSITFGGLTYKSRSTNAIFRWSQIGSIEYMTVADLNEMNNYKNDFLNKPLVVLLDDRAVKKFRLMSVYEEIAKINDLKTIFNSDLKTIESAIDNALLVGMRDILISKVRQMVESKTLVDINVIRLLEKKLLFDLSDSID